MDLRKIDKALEKLEALHYIEKYEYGYKFTAAGRAYTRQKSGHGWTYLSRVGNTELWLYNNNFLSWKFVPSNRITEEEFHYFCEYYNIKIEKSKQLVICDEIEFMDI